PAASPKAIDAGVPSRRSIGRSQTYPTTAGGTNEPAISATRRRSSSRTASPTSSRSAISSAAAVPACSATSNALRSSGSSSAYSQPSSHGTSSVCAELEIGSSSAGPCSAPSAIASGSFSRGTGAPPAQRQVREHDQQAAGDDVVDVAERVLPLRPV